MQQLEWLKPTWSLPAQVQAVSSTRLGGISQAPYAGFNLGDHVADDAQHVQANRAHLVTTLGLPAEPLWLQQVHSQVVIEADAWQPGIQADGCIARSPGQVCLVMTADCLPILLADTAGTLVAAVHAGWRGLCHGIIEQAITQMACSGELVAWIGPAIGAQHFEVDASVRSAFIHTDGLETVRVAFQPNRPGHWLADLVYLAKCRLHCMGVKAVFGGDWCTYAEQRRFYSYRREGQTGRMASLIWLQ